MSDNMTNDNKTITINPDGSIVKAKRLPPNAGKGRPVGAVNKHTAIAKEAIAKFVDKNSPRMQHWLEEVASGIPKTDKDTIARFNKAFEECKQANVNFFGGAIPKVFKGGLRDGDTEKEDPVYAGHYFINASGNEKPGVVDADLNPIIDPSEFYSGCYGRAYAGVFDQ